MFYVYILELGNKTFYVGRTDNLKQRFHEHTTGQERTTKKYLPCKLVTYIAFDHKTKAVLFERYLKTGSGLAFRKRHF